jgi:hypothetical protein
MSEYSTNLKIELMATGENASTWGDVTNTNLGTAIEEAIVGSANVTFASADPAPLTLSPDNGPQTARNMRLNLIGTTGGSTRNLVVPNIEKVYIVNNTCADSVVVKTAAGTGVTVPAGKTMWVYVTSTNVVDVTTHLTSLTLGSPLPVASGGTGSNTGSGAALTNLNASNVSSGTLAVTYGGTGGTTPATARVNLLPSYTANGGKVLALNAGASDTEWISVGGAGTVTSVNATTAISGLSFSGGPITGAGTLTLAGTLGVQGGGTGTTSLTSGAVLIGNGISAVSSVSPGTSGNVLTSNGSAWVSQAGGAGGVTSVTGSGSGILVSPSTGAVVVQNTGVTSITAGSGITVSANTGGITISASGSAGVSSISFGSTGLTPSTATTGAVTVSGTLAVANGGTGATSAANAATNLGLGTSSSVQHGSFGVGTAASGTSGEIRATNNVTAFYSSDARLKENVQPIQNALGIVSAVGGKTFDWTDAYIAEHGGADGYFVTKSDFGVIAQDVQAVFPLAVRTRDDGTLAVDYEKLVAVAFAAIAELKAEVEALKK